MHRAIRSREIAKIAGKQQASRRKSDVSDLYFLLAGAVSSARQERRAEQAPVLRAELFKKEHHFEG